jgi:hypothetical protein
VAAAIGYVIFIGLGGWPGLAEPGLAIPALPPYTSTSVLDLVLGVVVGVVTAVLVAAVRRGARTLSVEGGARVPMPVLLIGGGLAVGLSHRSRAGWALTRSRCCSPVRTPFPPSWARRQRASSRSCS